MQPLLAPLTSRWLALEHVMTHDVDVESHA